MRGLASHEGSSLHLWCQPWCAGAMARPLRIEYEGAFCHVSIRGNAGQDMFLGNEDRQMFLEIPNQAVDRFDWLCHAYCLMPQPPRAMPLHHQRGGQAGRPGQGNTKNEDLTPLSLTPSGLSQDGFVGLR